MRICGSCRACCIVFPLPVLEKPAHTPCRHLCAAGCGIHGREQPEVCREYTCRWLDHEELPEEYRPDRVGVVVTDSGEIRVKDRTLPVLVANLLARDGDRDAGARAMLADFSAAGMAVLVVDGPDLRIVYDRERHEGIGPEDIEEAFRLERAKDAAELRRLGAIDKGI
jgi:hypothetical protein